MPNQPQLSTIDTDDLNGSTTEPKISSVPGDDSQTLSDTVPRETTSPEPGRDVPRETTPTPEPETDLLGDAVHASVEQAVTQWVGFDPSIHSVNADGTPRLRVDGSYALKRGKGGRKSAVADTMPAGVPGFDADVSRETGGVIGAGPTVNAAAASMSNKQTALFLVASVTGILSRAIGPEWAAEKDEQKGLNNAVETYLDAKGGLQITPEMGLILALSAYAVPRLATENTQSKLSRFVGWCSDRVSVIRGRLGI